MRPKTAILGLVAVACGLTAAVMTQKVLKNSKETVEVAEEKVAVLVARNTINIGQSTKNPQAIFQVRHYLKGEQPKKAIQTNIEPDMSEDDVLKKLYEQVKDKRLNKQLAAEQWVSAEDL